MIKIAVASTNPVKVNSVKEAYSKLFGVQTFEVVGMAAPSEVPDQPRTDAETYSGAFNRANNLSKIIDADYFVGLESGIQEKEGEFEAFAWAVVKSRDGKYGKGRSATFFLPSAVATHIRNGMELGKASDLVFNESEVNKKQGTVGVLTNNVIDRTRFHADSVVCAFAPFKNRELYF